jgi:hypothetical protein
MVEYPGAFGSGVFRFGGWGSWGGGGVAGKEVVSREIGPGQIATDAAVRWDPDRASPS